MLTRYVPWLIWGIVLWGVLRIGELPWPTTHDICGPWGCGPPLPALVACHAAWLVIFAPIAYFVPVRLSCTHSRLIGWSMMGLAVLGLVGVGVFEAVTWLPAVDHSIRPYFPRRWAFVVVTLTDVPLLQTIALGACFAWVGREPLTELVSRSDQANTFD